jgi:CheY-like chemotaxis protein
MPICDGWQFLEEVESLPFADKLTIYVTSSTVEDDEIEKAKCYKSVKTFYSKPITSDILSKIIDDNLYEI